MTFRHILDTVVDNGRVEVSDFDPSKLSASSLKAEIEFEAQEQGLSAYGIDQAVEFGLNHSDHDGDF